MERRLRRVAAGLVVAALAAPGAVRAQAALTPADSAVLASQPLKRLILTQSLVRRLSLLAAGLDREVVLCLQGMATGDSAVAQDFVMPDFVSSARDAVQPQPCAPATLAVWHNHPLSQPDLRTVIADSVPFAVVSVGRARRPIVCWWRRVQAVINRHVKFLPRFPRQWLELPSLAGAADPPPTPPSASMP